MAPSQVLSTQSLPHVEKSYDQIQSYRFLHSGLNIVWDPLDEASIIAIIKFTPFDKLTASEKDDLNFLSKFLHNSKQSINPFGANRTTRTNFLDGTSSSLGLKSRLLLTLIIASPLGLVRLLNQDLMKKYNLPSPGPINDHQMINVTCHQVIIDWSWCFLV
ncbi:hypothetical protein VP01_4767g1 [Puccinia sorghi]|uniref:Uncharacterized protein n=1 Tax=Puccinia sorghi TaxID=27349 RepID=A0A0L6UMR5_9BASI|nr:hypothetical protein VP01_4767g1 [Puccinia sorghi]